MPNGDMVWTDRMVKIFHSWVLLNYRMEYSDLVAQVGSEKGQEIESFWLANVYPTVPELAPGYDPDLEPTPAEKKGDVEAEELYKQQAGSHIKMLDAYLYARERAGLIDSGQAEEVLSVAANLIKQGTSLERLPYHREVSSQPWVFEEEKPAPLPREVGLPERELAAIEARAGEPEFGRIMAEVEVPGASRPWTAWFQSRYGLELAKAGLGSFDATGAFQTWAEKLQKAYGAMASAAERAEIARGRIGETRQIMGGRASLAESYAISQAEKAGELGMKRAKTYRELLATSPKAEAERGWVEYLRKRVPELEEEYAGLYPWGMGGRPSAFAPRIRTV